MAIRNDGPIKQITYIGQIQLFARHVLSMVSVLVLARLEQYEWPESKRERQVVLVPSLVSALENIGSNISNLVISETSSKGGHGVLSVGDLSDDGLFGASSG